MAVHQYPVSASNNMWWNEQSLTGYVVVGNISGNAQGGAVRFPSVTVPQGTTVISANLYLYKSSEAVSGSVKYTIYGIDEDNTDVFNNPSGRPNTTATHNGETSANVTNQYVGFDVTNEANEIFARGGWASGNAIGFKLNDNETTTTDARITDIFEDVSSTDAYLEINWNEPSASPSASRSVSPSISPSASLSPSASASPSASLSPSPLPTPIKGIMKIAKSGINVLTNSDPEKLIFSSEYGTLKYYSKQTATVEFDANAGLIGGTTTITHDLGYYPYVEVFVSVYIGTPSGVYEYCPFAGAGATVFYDANYKITTTGIVLYGQIDGVSSSVWTFDFLVFIFKNNLSLS